jgi:anion-transporting  ArsA/GET3 family ATPase
MLSHRVRTESGILNSVQQSKLNQMVAEIVDGLRKLSAVEVQYAKLHPENKDYYQYIVNQYVYSSAQKIGAFK